MDDELETVRFEKSGWLAPVERPADLPISSVANGSLCYVKGKDDVYTLINGVWVMGAHRVKRIGD